MISQHPYTSRYAFGGGLEEAFDHRKIMGSHATPIPILHLPYVELIWRGGGGGGAGGGVLVGVNL